MCPNGFKSNDISIHLQLFGHNSVVIRMSQQLPNKIIHIFNLNTGSGFFDLRNDCRTDDSRIGIT